MSLEYCAECDQETGNAGIGDDSLYLEDGRGPLCDCCFNKHRVEELESELQRLRRVEEAAIILMKELKECGWTSPLESEPRFGALKAALEEK